MSTAEIVRVWGTADNIELELKLDNGRWICNLPPDLIDGQYAVQLFALRGDGSVGMWTGVLYVSNGIKCLHLNQEKYTLWLNRERCSLLLNQNENMLNLLPEQQLNISLAPERIKINLIKECCHNV